MVKIIAIPPQEVPAVFPKIKELIFRSLEYAHGNLTINDVYAQLMETRTVLFIITNEQYSIEAFIIADVQQYPQRKVIRILLSAGKNLKEWKNELLEVMTSWCKKIGASRIEIIGRKGWERALADIGFEFSHVVLTKEI